MDFISPNGLIERQWITQNLDINSKWGEKVYSIIQKAILQTLKVVKSDIPIRNISKDEIKSALIAWKDAFENLYPPDELTVELFSKHCVLMLILSSFCQVALHEDQDQIKKQLNIPTYFDWMNSHPLILESKEILTKYITEHKFASQDLFGDIYESFIANTTRHVQGEFYTPQPLCQLMVENSYRLGELVLDPACGSGTFLIEIMKWIFVHSSDKKGQKKSLSRIIGIDKNPIACIMSRTNILLLLKEHNLLDIKVKVYQYDSLQISCSDIIPKGTYFDLIIGNPPWLVINGIPSHSEKARIKTIGQDLGILCGGKLATSTELTTLFCRKLQIEFLKEEGTLHFVTPASLATGEQHCLFRQFVGWKNIEFWDFDQDFFRIHSLCFKATKGQISLDRRLRVKWISIKGNDVSDKLTFGEPNTYIPVIVEKKRKKSKGTQNTSQNSNLTLISYLSEDNQNSPHKPQKIDSGLNVGRLIPIQSFTTLFQRTKILYIDESHYSPYVTEFRQGASLVPRNLLFVDKIKSKNSHLPDDIWEISPASNLQSKKYSTWDFQAYQSGLIEGNYLFPIAKSTGLLSFHYFEDYWAALPLEKVDTNEYKVQLPVHPHAKAHFSNLITLYSQNLKPDAKITHLFQRLDYGHALSDNRQFAKIKIIFAGIGSNVKAAILQKLAIIDTSLYYYCPKSITEAYYLLGILNSSIATDYVRLTGSTGANGSLRNIHKHPLKLPFPKFDPTLLLHSKIIKSAQILEDYVQKLIKKLIKHNSELISMPKSLQNRLLKDPGYQDQIEELNQLVTEIMEW